MSRHQFAIPCLRKKYILNLVWKDWKKSASIRFTTFLSYFNNSQQNIFLQAERSEIVVTIPLAKGNAPLGTCCHKVIISWHGSLSVQMIFLSSWLTLLAIFLCHRALHLEAIYKKNWVQLSSVSDVFPISIRFTKTGETISVRIPDDLELFVERSRYENLYELVLLISCLPNFRNWFTQISHANGSGRYDIWFGYFSAGSFHLKLIEKNKLRKHETRCSK